MLLSCSKALASRARIVCVRVSCEKASSIKKAGGGVGEVIGGERLIEFLFILNTYSAYTRALRLNTAEFRRLFPSSSVIITKGHQFFVPRRLVSCQLDCNNHGS